MIERMKRKCPRLSLTAIIGCSGFSRSQVHQWRNGAVERKARESHLLPEQTVANAAAVISFCPHWGGRKGQTYMLYHRLGYIGMKAYDAVKKKIKGVLVGEAAQRQMLPGPNAYEHIRPERVGQIWAEDFTDLPVAGQRFKLAIVIDVFDQYKLGWEVGERATAGFVGRPVQQAVAANHGSGPEQFLLSDHGSQYLSEKHGTLLSSAQIVQRLVPVCRPQYNGWVECEQKEFKNVFYNVWERRERDRACLCEARRQADEGKSLIDRVRLAVDETARLLNEHIPRPSLDGVTPGDVHRGEQRLKAAANRRYRDQQRDHLRRRPPPWNRTYREVLHAAVAPLMMSTQELMTKLAFFCRRPLRQIARLNMEGVG